MRLGVRQKLILLGTLVVAAASFGFTVLTLHLWRGWVEEDLQERAVAFAREIAATIGDHREFESGTLLHAQIQRIMEIRQNVLQLDIFTFGPDGTKVVATSHPEARLPFSRREADRVRKGRIFSRLIQEERGRYWEVMAPITLEGTVAGTVAAKFSLDRADHLALRIRGWTLGLTAVSVGVMALLMGVAVHLVVNRPIQRFMETIARVRGGDPMATVELNSNDEFGLLASHFNDMVMRIARFNEELRVRVAEATAELDHRYQEVQRLNELLFRTQRSLSHAERLALSGQLMAEVAHEVGTPLHSIAGHLELLRKDLPAEVLSEDLTRRLAIIESQLTRVTEIIAQLLDLTRRSPGEPGPVDLNRLIRDTVELLRPNLATAGLSFEAVLDPNLPVIQGRANQLQQVVLNLVTNAMDATPAGGRVEVATRPLPAEGAVVVQVSDTGRGISSADQKQIFEPFFSTKDSGRGTGLGLFISGQIVRDHGGRMEVESQEGQGSLFRVLLPATRSAP